MLFYPPKEKKKLLLVRCKKLYCNSPSEEREQLAYSRKNSVLLLPSAATRHQHWSIKHIIIYPYPFLKATFGQKIKGNQNSKEKKFNSFATDLNSHHLPKKEKCQHTDGKASRRTRIAPRSLAAMAWQRWEALITLFSATMSFR